MVALIVAAVAAVHDLSTVHTPSPTVAASPDRGGIRTRFAVTFRAPETIGPYGTMTRYYQVVLDELARARCRSRQPCPLYILVLRRIGSSTFHVR